MEGYVLGYATDGGLRQSETFNALRSEFDPDPILPGCSKSVTPYG